MDKEKIKKLCEDLEELRVERLRKEARHELASREWEVKYNRALNELIRECDGKVNEPQKIFAEDKS